MSVPRLLMVQPSLQPPGGGSGVAAWMLQALRDDYALSVLSWTPVDLNAVNGYFGTALRPLDFTALSVSPALKAAVDRLPFPAATLKAGVLRRQAKALGAAFDLMITAHNETDFGRPGIQYVHYPVRHVDPLPGDLRWYHQRWALRGYEWLWSRIAPFDDAAMKTNLTLVNSAWTGALVSKVHGIAVRVVYPPAAGAFPDVPWADRAAGFVCLGRISPEKRIDRVIDIVARVRAFQPDAHLHIVGADDHPGYARHVRGVAARAGSWVHVEGRIPFSQLEQLLSSHRYVIHGMEEEHFGMSIAQAVCAGCIPFVPDGGGQVEIVGDEPALRYRSIDDAVNKVIAVMRDDALAGQIRTRLVRRAQAFRPEHFAAEIRRAVRDMLRR